MPTQTWLSMVVPVPVVDVGIVWMAVRQPFMRVRMRVWLTAVPRKAMGVLMVLVMNVSMRMLDRFMRVCVLVVLGQVQPYAARHQRGGDPEWH